MFDYVILRGVCVYSIAWMSSYELVVCVNAFACSDVEIFVTGVLFIRNDVDDS